MLLLCDGHHKQIDRKPTADNYPAELLRAWKKNREGDYTIALNGLTGLTEEGIKELMATAITETKNDLFNAIGDLKSASQETVDTLRSLVLEAFNQPYDSVQLLHEAAMRLSHLQDNTTLLYEAAMRLSHLQDNTSLLFEAAQDLKHLQDGAWHLYQAASNLEHLPTSTDRLWVTSDKLRCWRIITTRQHGRGRHPWHLVQQFIEASQSITRLPTDKRSTTPTASETQQLVDAVVELRDVSVKLKEVEGTRLATISLPMDIDQASSDNRRRLCVRDCWPNCLDRHKGECLIYMARPNAFEARPRFRYSRLSKI